MIIRETKIMDAWCPYCGHGQLQQILQKSFEEKRDLRDYIGESVTCQNCGVANVIEDIVTLIPQEFLVMSINDLSKAKSNDSLKQFLESE